MQHLQQIPVFALRQVVATLISDNKKRDLILDHYRATLNRKPKKIEQALQRLTGEQLVRLINTISEVSDDQIKDLFEEYRYGSNPSFYIYHFDPHDLKSNPLKNLLPSLKKEIDSFNTLLEKDEFPRVRRIVINDFGALPDHPEIIESKYHFQVRLEYIDENENPCSTYQVLYGFFWINSKDGYVIIHSRSPEILKGLRIAISKVAGIQITPLIISKELKNSLPFLLKESFRSGKLHDPDPNGKNFRWLSISDDDPYSKGYKEYEESYPEVHIATYKQEIDDKKSTSLRVCCDKGSLSLAGKLSASQFRIWCLDRLNKITSAQNAFRSNPVSYVQTHDLSDNHFMAKFNGRQQHIIREIISLMLTLKQNPGNASFLPLSISPIKLSAEMNKFVHVQVPYDCEEIGCSYEGYLTCGICDSTLFTAKYQGESLRLECRDHIRNRWGCSLPHTVKCEYGHSSSIDENDILESIEIILGDELLESISDIVNKNLPGYKIEFKNERLIIKGKNLFYFNEMSNITDKNFSKNAIYYINQEIGTVMPGSSVTGVQHNYKPSTRALKKEDQGPL